MKSTWKTRTLGEVCERVTVGHVGITTPFYSDRGILFLRTQNVGDTGLVLDDLKYVTPAFHASLKKSEVRAGDILMSRVITHTVRCALIPQNFGPANCANVVLVRPAPGLLPEFLAHYIRSSEAQRHLLDRKVGSAQLVVNTTVIRDWPITIPPADEQRRIVRILDEGFAGIATAKTNAEKNLQNARAVFDAQLDAVFSDCTDGCVRLDELFAIGSSKRVLKSEWQSKGVPFYRGREITRLALEGHVDNDLFISEEHFAELADKAGVPSPGDIVITAIGTIGNAHVVRADDRFYFKDASVLWMKRTSEISSDFVKFWIRSSAFCDQLERGKGATVDTLTIGKLQSLQFPVTSAKAQLRAVGRLVHLEQETRRLESLYRRKLDALDALKQSLLYQAFSGQL